MKSILINFGPITDKQRYTMSYYTAKPLHTCTLYALKKVASEGPFLVYLVFMVVSRVSAHVFQGAAVTVVASIQTGVWIRWTGMMEWNSGIDWTGKVEWNEPQYTHNSQLKSQSYCKPTFCSS